MPHPHPNPLPPRRERECFLAPIAKLKILLAISVEKQAPESVPHVAGTSVYAARHHDVHFESLFVAKEVQTRSRTQGNLKYHFRILNGLLPRDADSFALALVK